VVQGLKVFREWFAGYADQFVLIGGTAASLTMESAGLEFRSTKDLDIVLHVESLTPSFGQAFWRFVEAGGYEVRQSGTTNRPALYRFQKPAEPEFPVMIELFSRAPDPFRPVDSSRLTPIPFEDAASSLSAILLDDEYYDFLMGGRRESNGLPWIGEDRLIPLKSAAWLELKARKEGGEAIDSKTIRKHVNDVLRLSQLLAETTRIPVSARIEGDLRRFIREAAKEGTLDLKTVGIRSASLPEVLGRIGLAYGISESLAGSDGRSGGAGGGAAVFG
jgi:hypothetical protein